VRPQDELGLGDLRVVGEKYIAGASGGKVRALAMFRVQVQESSEDPKLDYASAMKTAVHQQRMRGLFDGLRKAGVPFVYSVVAGPAAEAGPEVMEFDLLVGTWADGAQKNEGSILTELEQRAGVLMATLSVALPNSNVVRLLRGELAGCFRRVLLPGDWRLGQEGAPAMAAALCEFTRMTPVVGNFEEVPEYYIPNASEAGRDGFLLGRTMSAGREFHDLRLQTSDLRGHVTVLGATGGGKSTTTGVIVRRAVEAGIPVLVLDWHNEYGSSVSAMGGKVVAPGKDGFSVNPLDGGPGADPVEHIATVSDIFSDIYHFTHPQAYMFRNALQKTMGDASKDEVPGVGSLVRTIEAYPLRSAYDNETKVALLRRLVPLTQGQQGKALGGPSAVGLEELMRTSVCVELGHMRDIQSRAVFSDVILKMVYEFKVREKSALDHVTVVEEARNIAPARRLEDPPSVGERMVSELRKFGEGMVFVAQFPTHIASEIVKNSGTKIVHRLGWPDDVSLIGDSLGMTQKQREHLTRLKAGEAVVGLARIQKPMLVQVDPGYRLAQDKSPESLAAVS